MIWSSNIVRGKTFSRPTRPDQL